jgi:hypothetical protein
MILCHVIRFNILMPAYDKERPAAEQGQLWIRRVRIALDQVLVAELTAALVELAEFKRVVIRGYG